MRTILLSLLLTTTFCIDNFAQELTGTQLLDKSIQYHDPNNQWPEIQCNLNLQETRPGAADRFTDIIIDLPASKFQLDQNRDGAQIVRVVDKTICSHEVDGKADLDKSIIEKYNLDCERTKRIRNYYVYLWGLPMKLKDPGTIIEEEVKLSTFQGTPCYAMKVRYNPEVGQDTWYFYFDKTSYALIGYRFYHEESKNDGEYITLEGEETVCQMKLPKTRKWYVNKDDKFLGSDILLKD